jgi:ATP-dependent helicase/nuclease subunit A
MNPRAEIPADTRLKQQQVSDPAVSAWVSANAGSGKTTVLVRRVIRLLLAGNPPARILCLTFTKAAAANMANKVLETLARWVRLDDDALDSAIREVSNSAPSPALRATARRLFAQALETPGGLKVQTIHAFCDRVLHQFPVEAQVQAGFEVLDEVQEVDLLRRAREAVLIVAAREPDGALGRALAAAVAGATDKSLDDALREAVRDRRKVARLIETGGEARIIEALGLNEADTAEAVQREILGSQHCRQAEWENIAKALIALDGNAAKCGERLKRASQAAGAAAVDEYLDVFFNEKGEPRIGGALGAGPARRQEPALFARLDAECERLLMLRDKWLAALARERTAALLVLAEATIQRFEDAKRARGALDYADLIEKTADMLNDTGSAWVLYKLDGGIDHVLVDEAQDTSPEQWSVIARLTEEFFAGEDARTKARTIFAVGDDKQSIFSFQGADPKQFVKMRDLFGRRVNEAGLSFMPRELLLSFRSAPGVLGAVDTVFERPAAYHGISSGEEKPTVHEAIRDRAPALVEIWETETPAAEAADQSAWDAPLDAHDEASPVTRLAQRIAKAVKHWIDGGLAIEDRQTESLRAPRAGDVIVLVRRRGPLFDAILLALKQAGVPVAGADRLKLSEHIAVMDLMALGDACLLASDDLALACALKSPLFGLSEDDLFALAHERKGSLAKALDEDARFASSAQTLARWRDEARRLRPFDFYSRVLGRDRGREQMIARLGHEAADALDEFLARALAYERSETPTLVGFLTFLRRAGTEVKRDLEVTSDAVRVMTVHGAKGLEAPLVILADTTTMPDGRLDERLMDIGEDVFVWAGRKDADSSAMADARARAADAREAEYRRLLYVALTRAADALVVCGAENAREKAKPGSWYCLVRDALEGTGPENFVATDVPYAAEKVWRWRPGETVAAPQADVGATAGVAAPPWLKIAAPAPPKAPQRIRPSDFERDEERLPAFAQRPGEALRRGDLVHRLLQHLPAFPPDERRARGQRFLAQLASDLPAADQEGLLAQALAVLDLPELQALFGPESIAEVDLLSRGETEVFGRIDRIAVSADCITIADFKTGRPPAPGQPVPGNYIQQLARYCERLARIYPRQAMRAVLIWTEGPAIHEISAERLERALRNGVTPT